MEKLHDNDLEGAASVLKYLHKEEEKKDEMRQRFPQDFQGPMESTEPPRYDRDEQWDEQLSKIEFCGKSAFCRKIVMEKFCDNDLQGAAAALEILHKEEKKKYLMNPCKGCIPSPQELEK